jgi:predicted enzyme related to lactoylglutathione lyase
MRPEILDLENYGVIYVNTRDLKAVLKQVEKAGMKVTHRPAGLDGTITKVEKI